MAESDLAKECNQRLAAARSQKADVELDLREGYYFVRPRLANDVNSTRQSVRSRRETNADELATTLATEVAEDFATEVINAFMPPHFSWAQSRAGLALPEEAQKEINEAIKSHDKAVFSALRASNFDAELATALNPDGALGTVALYIDEGARVDPIRVQHIPIRELEIHVGPYGVDDRFIVRWVRGRAVQGLIGGRAWEKVPGKVKDHIKNKGNEPIEVRWGWWRDWSEENDVVWQAVLMVKGEMVEDAELRGDGACPLIVFRYSPDSASAWGEGPTLKSLPHLRVLDEIAKATQDRVDIAVNPPLAFPDDSAHSFEDGIEAGKAYPIRPGSGKDIVPLYFAGDPQVGYYTLADLERSIRRLHFADYPEQRGDTPPTATQWVDEMVRSQRRIGTPGAKLWQEGPCEIFKRFAFLAYERGEARKVEYDGKLVMLRPYNPAAKAQEHQEVQVALSLLGAAKGFFPETSQAAIDEHATIENMQKKMGDELVVLRDKAEVARLVQQMLSTATEMGAAPQ